MAVLAIVLVNDPNLRVLAGGDTSAMLPAELGPPSVALWLGGDGTILGTARPGERLVEFARRMNRVTPRLWQSPCGADQTIFSTGPTFVRGLYSFAPLFFSPYAMTSVGNASTYGDCIGTYRQNMVMFLDPYCNPAGTSMMSIRSEKRGLSVLLSGQLLNRRKEGNAFFLQWWSDPAD